eukprot:g7129.t1
MDCAEDSHMIMLSSNSTIQLESTILINKQVTISGFHYQEADLLDVTYPASKRKTVVTCPENSIHDIFNINSGGAIVTNLEARDFMSPKNAFPAAIEECRNNIGGLKPHHVDFVSNTSSLQPVTVHTLPGSISCGALEMTDILFQGNKAGNHRVFVKIQFETIMKNIRIGNSQPKNGNEQENNFFLITIMEKHKDILTINSLAAIGYSVPIIKARFGVVNILGSVFEENKFNMEDNKIKLDASMIQFSSASKVTIRDCLFNNNVGGGQGVILSDNMSSIEILNSALSQNSKHANVIFTAELEIKTKYWDLVSNIGRLSGGVLHMEDSNATITNSTFSENMSDDSGGAVYAVKNSNIRVQESRFKKNQAREGGCFHIEESDVSILRSSFKQNKAKVDGGAIRLERGGVLCRNSDFTYNTALDDRGAFNIENATYVDWTGVRFSNNHATFGSSVRVVKCKNNVLWKDVNFQNSTVGLTGAAAYTDASKVIIDGAIFQNLTAPYGGALYAQSFNITIKNAFFENNHARVMGGAISVEIGTIIFKNITFIENSSMLGGALHFYNSNFIASDISFEKNTAFDGAGLLFKHSNVSIGPWPGVNSNLPASGMAQWSLSFGISDFNNTGVDNGGAFMDNSAPEDGAIFITSVNAVVENYAYDSNADDDGGAAFIQKSGTVLSDEETFNNRSVTQTIGVEVKNCCFISNKAGTRDGAIMLRGELLANMQFITSTNGTKGFRYVENGFNVEIKSVNFSNNRVYTEGGAIHGKAVNLIMRNATVMNNGATEGGGACLVQTVFSISGSKIISNQAENGGGGIKATQESHGIISSTMIINNKVTKQGEGGGLRTSGCTVKGQDLYVEGNHATFGGGVSLALVTERDSIVEQQDADSRFLCLSCIFINNKAFTSGGGLNIQHQNSNSTVVAQLVNCTLEDDNVEVFGGGIHVGKPAGHLDTTNEAPCGYLVILNTNFTRNRARRSEGSLIPYERYENVVDFLSAPDSMSLFNFSNTKEVWSLHSCNTSYHPQWNERINAKKIPTVSSYVNRCQATIESKDNWGRINSNQIEISGTVPGERLPDIMVHCYDEFDNIAKSDSDGFTATLKSTDEGDLQGIFVANLEKGTGKFTGVRNPADALSFNGSYTYQLEISFSLDYVLPITIQMNVRECRINEEKESEGVLCKKCDATQYNFDPMSESCKPCDDTLNCSTPFVRPGENYWNLSPCHVPAQKCLTAYACEGAVAVEEKVQEEEYKNIKEVLDNYSCNKSEAARKEYQKLLCKEGYKGVLCGSCKANYSRSLSLACTKCNSPGLSVLTLASVCIWLALIAGITIRGSTTIEERLSVINKKLNDLAARESHTIIESLPEEVNREDYTLDMIEEERDKQIEDQSLIAGPSTERRHKRITSDLLRSTNMSLWQGCNLSTDTVDTIADSSEKINNLRLAQLAKWKLREVFKVTINFLQTIALAAVINVEWTRYMLIVFNISAFVGDASTALVTRASQCLPWWRDTKYATYLGLVSGLLIPIFVILCMVAFFAFQTYKSSKGMYYFVKRSVFATLAICYFSYLNITRVAVMFFYCVGVYTNENFSSHKETYYLAFDTSIQCSASYHKKFMVFGRILFALFSVGFPLISAAVLVLFRKDSGRDDPQWMSDILGFLYRAYKRKFVYWESIVMLRKALLSVITIFSYHLGGHTQSLLAFYILSACLFLQAICRPYRHEFESLNTHESLSLLISSTTFTLALFFTKNETDQSFKLFLNLSLLFAIVGFLLFMTISMLICLLDVRKTNLKVTRGLSDDNKNFWSAVSTWISYKVGFIERSSNNDDENDMELGSIKSKKLIIDNDVARYGP